MVLARMEDEDYNHGGASLPPSRCGGVGVTK